MHIVPLELAAALLTTKTCLFKYTENILKILPPKNEKFQIKKFDIFHISAQNIECEYSLEPQSMFLSRNKKNNVYPCKPQPVKMVHKLLVPQKTTCCPEWAGF